MSMLTSQIAGVNLWSGISRLSAAFRLQASWIERKGGACAEAAGLTLPPVCLISDLLLCTVKAKVCTFQCWDLHLQALNEIRKCLQMWLNAFICTVSKFPHSFKVHF